jgi:hypothetical protein
MTNFYTIKFKNPETNENQIKTLLCKTAKEKYDHKMENYRKNFDRKVSKMIHQAEIDIKNQVEETIVEPHCVTTKPRPNHGTKTDIIFEWSETAKLHKELLAKQRLERNTIVGKVDNKLIKENKVLKWIHELNKKRAFKNANFSAIDKFSREELHKIHELRKSDKAKKYEDMQFSEWHHKLVTFGFTHYSPAAQLIKHQAEDAKHNIEIENLAEKLRQNKHKRYNLRFEVICDTADKGLHCLMTQYTNKAQNVMEDVCKRLADKFEKSLKNFSHIKLLDNHTNKLLMIETGGITEEKKEMLNKLKLNRLAIEQPDYYTEAA